MEAMNIPQDKNVASLLNCTLSDWTTYNIGMSGHTIYTCVQNLKNAMDCYQPGEYVILETSTIDLEDNKMQQVLDESYPEIPSYDSGLHYTIQKKFPVVKAVYKSLDEWWSVTPTSGGNDAVVQKDEKSSAQPTGNKTEVEHEDRLILNQFIKKAADAVNAAGAEFIIFYHPKTEIDRKGNLINYTNEDALVAFQKACVENDVIFVDMTEDFEKLYLENHVLAHGFINTAVGVGHLNQDGHRVIAERLVSVIGGKSK